MAHKTQHQEFHNLIKKVGVISLYIHYIRFRFDDYDISLERI